MNPSSFNPYNYNNAASATGNSDNKNQQTNDPSAAFRSAGGAGATGTANMPQMMPYGGGGYPGGAAYAGSISLPTYPMMPYAPMIFDGGSLGQPMGFTGHNTNLPNYGTVNNAGTAMPAQGTNQGTSQGTNQTVNYPTGGNAMMGYSETPMSSLPVAGTNYPLFYGAPGTPMPFAGTTSPMGYGAGNYGMGGYPMANYNTGGMINAADMHVSPNSLMPGGGMGATAGAASTGAANQGNYGAGRRERGGYSPNDAATPTHISQMMNNTNRGPGRRNGL